uniref:Uncharacterized protein n=1 Tax=Clytia hemisphaerica TaxID=252671 RepID=A0A7M5WJS3_9CNID
MQLLRNSTLSKKTLICKISVEKRAKKIAHFCAMLAKKTSSKGHEQYSEYTTTHTTTKKKNSFKLSMPNIQCPQDTSEAIRQRPALNRTKSEDSQTSGIDMRISEQDLGSDAESLPSCEESLTNSENSPPNSPELFKQKQEVSRRESAPASFNIKILDDIQGLNEINEERSREFHRRYSSVEERTSRVRFNLEESFKEEEDHYSKQFDENEEQPKFSDIEGYKVAPLTQYPRKVSSPPCLSCDIEEVRQEYQQNQQVPTAQRKDSSDRSRKCSVYSDNSGSIQILPGQSVRKVSSQENLIREEEESTPIAPLRNKYDRKISLQEPKLRKDSRVDNRKLSLQENSSRRKSVCIDEKSTNENSRKFSLQIPRRRPSFSDRKLSLQERKNSTHERKMSSHDRKYSAHERKISSSERKYSAHERKLSQQETRKTSLTDTFRSVVGTKKKSERKASQEVLADENNNVDRKSAWGLIKNKIKKDRKSSAEAIQQGSPRMLRLLSRNDSSSSIDSGTPRRHRRSGSAGKRASTRSEDYDQKSISSFNSVDLEDEPDIVPPNAFDLWSEGKVDIETESSTLPLLHVAAGEGNAELLKTLLDVGVDMNELDQCGWPALHYAVCAGHFECAQLLLSRGATLKNYSNRVMNTYCTAVRDCIRTGSPYSST